MRYTMKIAAVVLPGLLLSGACLSHAALWGRGKLPAPGTPAPITVDGRLADWPPGETYDAVGLRFRAANDGENLYLSVSAHETAAKAILTGEIRQDVILWFYDRNARDWGLRLPFGALGVPVQGLPTGSVKPELLIVEGTAVSTSPLPANIEFGGEIPGRVPIYELKIPLALIKDWKNGVGLDFITAYASAELEQRMREIFEKAGAQGDGQARAGMRPPAASAGRGGGKMGGGKRGGGRGGPGTRREFPSPLEIKLSVAPGAADKGNTAP
jgi:hypothetical protein